MERRIREGDSITPGLPGQLRSHPAHNVLRVVTQIDQRLLVALTRAFYWQQLLDDSVVGSGSEIAQREGLHHSTVNELLRLRTCSKSFPDEVLISG